MQPSSPCNRELERLGFIIKPHFPADPDVGPAKISTVCVPRTDKKQGDQSNQNQSTEFKINQLNTDTSLGLIM